MKPVILDCDPGHDDAIAILLALSSDKVDVRLISVVAGNHTLDHTLNNALKVVSVAGGRVEVAPGCPKPLIYENEPAVEVHGESGLDGPVLPEPTVKVSERTALEAQASVLRNSQEKVTIIPTGPLTNIAVLLTTHPELKGRIERIVLMGGACFGGNKTPNAEFNIYMDPEAADIVFRSGVPITMCGLDVTLKAQVFPEEFERFRRMGNKSGRLVAELLDYFHRSTTPYFLADEGHIEGAHLHDVCAVAYVLAPELFTVKSLYVQVERSGALTRGCTVVDYNGVYGKPPNAEVCFNVHRQKLMELLYKGIVRLD